MKRSLQDRETQRISEKVRSMMMMMMMMMEQRWVIMGLHVGMMKRT